MKLENRYISLSKVEDGHIAFPWGVVVFWVGLALSGVVFEGTWWTPSLYERIFAVGYRYEPTSSYVEKQEHMIEIQKNGGEKEETLDEHDRVHFEYTSVTEAKQMQREARADALAALRDSSLEKSWMRLVEPIYTNDRRGFLPLWK